MKKILKYLFNILIIGLFFYSIINANNIIDTVKEGILISGNNIIPSLFPTLCIVTIIIDSGMIFSLNKKSIPLFLFILAQISGYPTGAKILNSCTDKKIINKNEAANLLPAFICPGPAFVISFAGGTVFNNSELGLRMYVSILMTNTILFLMFGGYKIKIETANFEQKNNFTDCIISSAASVFKISVLFIFFYAFLKSVTVIFSSTISTAIYYFFEITGLVLISKNIYITCSALSFGGICVLMQIKDITVNYKFEYKRLIFIRLFSAILSALILKVSLTIIPIKNFVYSNFSDKISLSFGGNIGYIIVAFLSIIVLLGSLSDKNILKKAKNF